LDVAYRERINHDRAGIHLTSVLTSRKYIKGHDEENSGLAAKSQKPGDAREGAWRRFRPRRQAVPLADGEGE
jgi:hypothetical protein